MKRKLPLLVTLLCSLTTLACGQVPLTLGHADTLFAPQREVGMNIRAASEYWRRTISRVSGGVRILTLGDSTCEGYTLSDYQADSWPHLLGHMLRPYYGTPGTNDEGIYWPSIDGFGSSGSLWSLSTGWTQYDQSLTNSGPGIRTCYATPSSGRAMATITMDGSAAESVRRHRRISGFELVAAATPDSGKLYIDVFSGSAGGTVGAGSLYSGSINLAGSTLLGRRWGFIPVTNSTGPITIQIASELVGSGPVKALWDGIVTYGEGETSSTTLPSIQVINLANGGSSASDWNPNGGTGGLILAAQLANWDDSVGRAAGTTTRRVSAVYYSIGYNDVYNMVGSQKLSTAAAATFLANVVGTGQTVCSLPSRPLLILAIPMQPKGTWCGKVAWDQIAALLKQAASQLIAAFPSQVMLLDERAWNDFKPADDPSSPAYILSWMSDPVHTTAGFHRMKATRIATLLR